MPTSPQAFINEKSRLYSYAPGKAQKNFEKYSNHIGPEPEYTEPAQTNKVDTSRLHERSFWDEASKYVKKEIKPIVDLARDTFHYKPFDQLSPEEKRAKFARWHEEAKHSHIPKWYQKAQHWITVLDNIEDALSTAGALSRLAAYLFPEAAPVLMPLSAALELASFMLDIPKDFLAVPGGPMGIKGAAEDVLKLSNPSKVLRQILKKEVPKTLKEALPTFGEAIEMAQVADNLFGVGLCLGPIMGKISNLWFASMEKVGILPSKEPHHEYPHRKHTRPKRHNKPVGGVHEQIETTTTKSDRYRISSIPVPVGRGSPIEFIEIPVGETIICRKPNWQEFQALKLWEYAYHVLATAPATEETNVFKAMVAHTLTLPWAWQYLSEIEWEKLVPYIVAYGIVPEMPWTGESAEWLKYHGLNPYEPLIYEDIDGHRFESYEDILQRNAVKAQYRIFHLGKRHIASKQSWMLHTCLSYATSVYAHALQPSDLEFVGTETFELTGTPHPIYRRTTTVKETRLTAQNATVRLAEFGFKLAPDTDKQAWEDFVNEYDMFVKVNGRYPRRKELIHMAFKLLGKLSYRGVVYSSIDKLKKDHPGIL